MKSKHYDEFQLLKRYQIGFQTLIILVFLVLLSGFMKEFYFIWATPLVEATILIYIPLLYFILMGIIRNAYLTKRDTALPIIILFGMAFLLNVYTIIQSIVLDLFSLVEAGRLSNDIVSLLLVLFTGIIFFSLVIKRIQDRRVEKLDK